MRELRQILLTLFRTRIKFPPDRGRISSNANASVSPLDHRARHGTVSRLTRSRRFKPFVQVARTHPRHCLGLSISRELARACKADLSATTSPQRFGFHGDDPRVAPSAISMATARRASRSRCEAVSLLGRPSLSRAATSLGPAMKRLAPSSLLSTVGCLVRRVRRRVMMRCCSRGRISATLEQRDEPPLMLTCAHTCGLVRRQQAGAGARRSSTAKIRLPNDRHHSRSASTGSAARRCCRSSDEVVRVIANRVRVILAKSG